MCCLQAHEPVAELIKALSDMGSTTGFSFFRRVKVCVCVRARTRVCLYVQICMCVCPHACHFIFELVCA